MSDTQLINLVNHVLEVVPQKDLGQLDAITVQEEVK